MSPLRRLLAFARPWRSRILLASACSVLNKLFDLAPPALIGAAVDIVVNKEDSYLAALGVADVEHQLWVLAGLTVAVWGLESAFEYAFQVIWRTLAQQVEHAMRVDTYAHLQGLELRIFEDGSRSTGGLMSVLNDDVNQLERFLDGGANQLLQVATTVVVVSGLFFWAAPTVAWLALLPVPIILFGSFRFQSTIAPRYAAVREMVGRLNGQLANNLGGILTIKSFTAEQREVDRIAEASKAYETANAHAIRLSSLFVPVIRMAIVIGFTATLVWGGMLTLRGQLGVGAYSVLVFMTQRLLWPLTRLGETFDLYQRAMASTTRILDLLDLDAVLPDGDRALDAIDGQLTLTDVDFRYADDLPLVLDGVSLEVPAGHTVAVVGSTGSGKTTLIKLLLRFYDPTAGQVTLDGHPLPSLSKESLRQGVALVSQDVFLFAGTIRENIAYGAGDPVSDEQVEAAARVAEAHDFITALPDGYDSRVGERGQRLSGGQRQRLSIARAVLSDAPILVLDEATSAVDNETEAAIQRSLERIGADRTVIVIAHRLSTVRHADTIVVLEAGQIAEQGTHEELLATGGLYAALWKVQTGERAA